MNTKAVCPTKYVALRLGQISVILVAMFLLLIVGYYVGSYAGFTRGSVWDGNSNRWVQGTDLQSKLLLAADGVVVIFMVSILFVSVCGVSYFIYRAIMDDYHDWAEKNCARQ